MFAEDRIMIGWSKADGLLDESLTKDDFREIVHKEYFPKEENKKNDELDKSPVIFGDLFVKWILNITS